MVEDILVKEILTEDMLQTGGALIQGLHEAGLKVTTACWLYVPEANRWRLIIASPEVGTRGPKSVYQKVQAVLVRLSPERPKVALQEISVVEETNPLMLSLHRLQKIGHEIAGTRCSQTTIDGHFIEDAYIYRVA